MMTMMIASPKFTQPGLFSFAIYLPEAEMLYVRGQNLCEVATNYVTQRILTLLKTIGVREGHGVFMILCGNIIFCCV